ncbi:MAG: hypothetical protein IH605_08370 [Burkholderiales bacterium]|nr:hypothetical protein [Burkholderiales bacterium]
MSTRDEYVRKMHAKLDTWNAEIDRLAAKADQAGAEARAGYHKQLDALRLQRDDAKMKMERLQSAGESAWQDMKAGVESAWHAMGEAIDSAKSRFK